MNKAQKMLVVAVIVIALPIMIGFVLNVTTGNKEVRLRNQIEAQQQVLASHHDKMWKTLAQKAQVSSEYKDAFKGIYPDLIAGRYKGENGGAKMFMAKVVKEDNPDFDNSLYKDLSRAIEAERTAYHREQSELLDLKRAHDDLVETFPGSVLLDVDPIEVKIITSSRTDNALETGKDDDVDLF